MCAFVFYFFRAGRLPTGARSSFVTLIPKRSEAMECKDFRPISLVFSYYKIISKILAARLSSVMEEFLGVYQHGFRPGMQTLDCIIVANEIIHHHRSGKHNDFLLKLDFEKAYDTVHWGYLEDVLNHMGFGKIWISWVMDYMRSNRMSILVNGSPTREFGVGKCLRQGCSLSPMLFHLVAEGLSRMLLKAKSLGLISGLGDVEEGWNFIHIQYAGDTLLFVMDDIHDLMTTQGVLLWFEAFSGLLVNYSKSSLVGIGMPESRVLETAQTFGCLQEHLPFNYLGSQVGFQPSSLASWTFIVERFRKKLASWKGRLLSIGGRLTLIKSVISSMSVYHCFLYVMPKGVIASVKR